VVFGKSKVYKQDINDLYLPKTLSDYSDGTNYLQDNNIVIYLLSY